ncbi:ABC transporter substrate-binding protein [Sodalinema sp.]|uniref:ABC transporter substrate-binding protein n=1 Tax=Sodalinema sp. TaxID=3080550 RepID=UPI00121F6198|nr:MAG: sugar ABC transporter substrate-binding protein [Phormidium sp. SL48-SHIP]
MPKNSRQRQGIRTKMVLGLGLTLTSLLLVLACGSPRTVRDETTVEFWTMQLQPTFNDYFGDLIEAFEADHPELEVRWIDVPWSAMKARILTSVSARTAPDLVNLNPGFSALLAGRGAWLNLDESISEEVRSQYLENIWDASRFEGQSFGIPWYLTTRITIYNEALLAEAGIEEAPQTYEALATVAQQVREETGKYAFFVTLAANDSGEVLESLVQMGVQLLNDDGTAAFNSPEGVAAFNYWRRLYQEGWLPREVLTQGHQRAIELYQAGELALVATGPQFFQTISNNAPDIAAVSRAAPQITGETGKISVAVMNVLIPRDTVNPEGAIAFALFLTNPDNQLAFSQAANTLPSTRETLNHPYFQELGPNAKPVDQARIMSAEQLERAEVLIPPQSNVNDLQEILYDNLQAVLLGQKSVEVALADAEQDWNAIASSLNAP